MQEGILQIGKAVYNNKDFLANIIKRDIDIKDKKGNSKHIIQIDFNTKEEKIDIKLYGEARKSSAEELLWIGTADGPSKPQWYTTGNKSFYLISQTIPNLIRMKIKNLSEELEPLLEIFFFDAGEQEKKNERYRYVIDLSKVSMKLKSNREIFEEIFKNEKSDIKKFIKAVDKEVNEYIKEKFDIKSSEVALYFLSINGKPISDNLNYKKRIVEEKLKAYAKGESGTCSICGSRDGLSSDTSRLKLKFYTTTNLNFPSNFSKTNYSKNMLLCKNCMLYLMTGEQFIMDNLSTNLGSFQVYLIPHFLYNSNMDINDMKFIASKLIDTFNMSKNIESIVNFESEISDTFELNGEDNYYLINILFYNAPKGSQAFKVQKLIKDVPPSRFKVLIDNSFNVRQLFKNLISEKLTVPFGLESVYYLIPVRKKRDKKGKEKTVEYRKQLNIYNAIFKQIEINKNMLINSQVNMLKIHYFNNHKNYFIKPASIHEVMIQSNMFLKFLESIGCLKEGRGMEVQKLDIESDVKKYIEEMRYSEEETAMFLLGYLVGKIGNKQYNERSGKKPILNKLNFNGMDLSKVKRLSSEIVDKLRQNKILKYNEKIYFAHKKLFDKHIKNWSLNKHDNLYYILSGYSYSTTKAILKEGGEDNE
ncbi:TIGR02556 family CRISPR-associated protein [Caloranaerobacter sp. DY30410]|uniref:TIGR02556 family CRISPR-associated protein n=1 Tax=Caloranaerobacter sp. DY30410 TaxID=3238305 RepID=UPI003D08C819